MNPKPIELLAPAGNFEKLECAIHFGADAVYIGAQNFSLRSNAGNFDIPQISFAIKYAHARNVKVYVAVNIYPRIHDEKPLSDFLSQMGKIGPDALIIADPGIFLMAENYAPQIPVHVSTQANTTSARAALFWKKLGAVRINTARELSIAEIKAISSGCDIEVEAFVHGAMCISHSGRCLLSSFLAGRDANQGDCAQPCRWQYHVVEEMRPGLYMPVTEDSRGTYIFHSKDLCMIDHVPKMADAGIVSFKIEGRMKGLNYLAATVKTYREAIDTYLADRKNYRVLPRWRKELENVNPRGYCTGLYLGALDAAVSETGPLLRADQSFIGKIKEKQDMRRLQILVKNRLETGAEVEIISPAGPARSSRVAAVFDENGLLVKFAQPNMCAQIVLEEDDPCLPGDIIRKIDGSVKSPSAALRSP
ncbi:MAG: U32 family peptidase [Deltaproteobacteria bacterium]|nr:U32 family peptidase [Deltaproteobacteria bacterium]